tara:strand:- start:265 stop:1014 length:750 start_codon:yes stop_codon:yes gene_type:complete
MWGLLVLALVLILGCSKDEPTLSPSKKSGLRLSTNKRTPKDLAKAFQESLRANDADKLIALSILGQDLQNWKVIATAQNARLLKLLETELAEAEKTPRKNRTVKEQARYFTLHSEIDRVKKSHTDEYWKAQEAKLPKMRRQFTEHNYLRFVMEVNEAGINPEQVTLVKVDVSRVTKNYLEANLHGGTVILHYEDSVKSLETGIAFDCTKFSDKGWLIVGQPRVIRHTAIGPQPEPDINRPEPFATPTGE